jgi:hypothetical protein
MGETRGVAVKDDAVYHPPFEGGQEVEFAIREIEHREMLRQYLGLSASASYSGIFSVEAKAQWSNEMTLEGRYLYLLISVKVTNTAISLKRYELTDEAKAMFTKTPYDWKGFYKRYGDHFIHSIVSGGEFYALYEFQTKSRKEKDELKTSLKGSYGGFKARAEFEKKVEKLDATTDVSVTWFVRGGRGKLPDPLVPEKLLKAALSFPQAVDPEKGAPVAYRAETRDYNIAEGFPAGEEAPFYSKQAAGNHECFAMLARLNDRVADAHRTVLNGMYGEGLEEQVSQLKEKVENEARAVANNPFIPQTFPVTLEEQLKALKRQLLWRPMPGNLVQISVGSHAHIWGLDKDDKIYRWNQVDEKWEEKPGRLCNISVGADGFVMGLNRNHDIFAWDMGKNNWAGVSRQGQEMGGPRIIQVELVQLSVENKNRAWWGITTSGFLCRFSGGKWIHVPFGVDDQRRVIFRGEFKAVSAGNDETVWLLDKSHRGYRYLFHQAKAEPIPGELMQISVGDARHIWGLDTRQQVVRWTGSEWHPVPGALASIAASEDGAVWGITHKGIPVRFEEET